jgi:hypothetical protein
MIVIFSEKSADVLVAEAMERYAEPIYADEPAIYQVRRDHICGWCGQQLSSWPY